MASLQQAAKGFTTTTYESLSFWQGEVSFLANDFCKSVPIREIKFLTKGSVFKSPKKFSFEKKALEQVAATSVWLRICGQEASDILRTCQRVMIL